MTDRRTLLLAGRMSTMRRGWLEEWLTSEWTMQTWSEDEPDEALTELASRADAIVAGRLSQSWPPSPRLKLFQIPFTGYDWIGADDLPRGCIVCNTFEHEAPVAEYVLAAMLERAIGIAATEREFRAQGWGGNASWAGADHGELLGKTVGIIGYGRIGREVAHRAAAFGMRTIAVSRTVAETPAPLDWLGGMARLDELVGESDYVLVALPLNEETRDLFDAARLAAMKPGAVIINVGRGRIINERALYDALKERRIGGAIIDVWYTYPQAGENAAGPSNLPFHELDNITMTPHFSAHTDAMRARRWRFVAQNLDRLARGEALHNVCFEGTA